MNARTRPEASTGGEAVGTPGAGAPRDRDYLSPGAPPEGTAIETPGGQTPGAQAGPTVTLRQFQSIERAMNSLTSPGEGSVAGESQASQRNFSATLEAAEEGGAPEPRPAVISEGLYTASQVEAMIQEAIARSGTTGAGSTVAGGWVADARDRGWSAPHAVGRASAGPVVAGRDVTGDSNPAARDTDVTAEADAEARGRRFRHFFANELEGSAAAQAEAAHVSNETLSPV